MKLTDSVRLKLDSFHSNHIDQRLDLATALSRLRSKMDGLATTGELDGYFREHLVECHRTRKASDELAHVKLAWVLGHPGSEFLTLRQLDMVARRLCPSVRYVAPNVLDHIE